MGRNIMGRKIEKEESLQNFPAIDFFNLSQWCLCHDLPQLQGIELARLFVKKRSRLLSYGP
jgi:hypothetical protein